MLPTCCLLLLPRCTRVYFVSLLPFFCLLAWGCFGMLEAALPAFSSAACLPYTCSSPLPALLLRLLHCLYALACCLPL